MGDKIMVDAGDSVPVEGPIPDIGADVPTEDQMHAMSAVDFTEDPEKAPDVVTPEPEPEAEPTEPVEVEEPTEKPAEGKPEEGVFESEADFLKQSGIEGYETVAAFKAAQDQAFEQLKQVFEQVGLESPATNINEYAADMIQRLMQQQGGAPVDGASVPDVTSPAPKGQDAPPLSLEQVFAKHAEHLDLDPRQQALYSDIAGAIAKPLHDAQSRVVNAVQGAMEMQSQMFALMQYQHAAQKAGDEPIPSFAEAYALMENAPKLKGVGEWYFKTFKDPGQNKMNDVFAMWRAQKLPAGVTNAQKAKADAQARKLKIGKSLIRSTPAERAKTKTFAERSEQEQTAFLGNLPA